MNRHTALRRLLPVVTLTLLVGGCASGARPTSSTSDASLALPSGGAPAPDFLLRDQFGHPERLSDFRGDIVVLTFIDSRCTTLCPLTAELMRKAKDSLGPGAAVQLIAINANPTFTSVAAVRRWSAVHRMTHRWLFLTASKPRLEAVWNSYGIEARIVQGDVAHTAVVFVIDSAGRTRTIFPIAGRSGIDAEAEALAQDISQVANQA